ncbi:MAG: hypothetical protein JO328_10860 [Hyphomicrobiales bacterium]|nr:hypothetical protein [Hyphomicrobiales bacterium]MBV8827148.1 hypothetical protein [Hyphomicrobiales bacterium]MBV9427954.1 hypothetical protein [Bradyrhizobiaceae bacterium]
MTDQSHNGPPPVPKFTKAELTKDVSWLGARLREPSSWAAVSALLGVLNLSLDPGLMHDLSLIGMGLGGVIAFVLPEGK